MYFDISYSPVKDDAGNVVAVFCLVNETTDRVGYEITLRRLAAIVASSEDAILGIDLDKIITDWNGGAELLYGYSAEEIVGRPVSILIPENRLDEEKRIIDRISAGERVEPHETVRRHKSGRLVEVSLSVSPINDALGRVVGASKIARDITARKEAERVQNILIGELNHRVKNVLATVIAIARQTFGRATDMELATSSFDARLRNLARAHDLLTYGSWNNAIMGRVVAEALSPYPADQIRVEGPELDIPPKAVVALALILHELATNAAKYGALSVLTGRVEVSWVVEGSDDIRLKLLWRETGGPSVSPPSRTGFGSKLITSLVEGQLQGKCDIAYDADGVHCKIVVPLATDWVDGDHEVSTS